MKYTLGKPMPCTRDRCVLDIVKTCHLQGACEHDQIGLSSVRVYDPKSDRWIRVRRHKEFAPVE